MSLMKDLRIGLAFVLVGVALPACSSSPSNSQPGGSGQDGGTGAAHADGAPDSMIMLLIDSGSLGSAASSASSVDSGSSSGGGGDSGSSSGSGSGSSSSSSSTSSSASGDSGSSSASGGFAIPLSAPDGADFEYTAQVTVGDQSFVMSIDTGSSTAAVAGTSCSGCTGVTPLYTPSSSATATGKRASSQYEDGSGWSGPVYTDTVGLGNGSPSVSLSLADITKATSFFQGMNDYQGILGLGPTQNVVTGTTAYMPAVMAAGVANIFAFQLCDGTGADAGTMWLGGNGGFGGTIVYTPLVAITNNNPYYAINVDSMSLGGTSVVSNASATFAQPVLDTGTSLFYVPTSVFNAFQTALQASSGFKAVFGTSTFATSGQNAGCLTDSSVTDAQVESMLPQISLSLPNVTSGQPDVTIEASALDTYLYNGGSGSYCLAIQDGGTQDPSTFGDAFMQAFGISIDLDKQQIGFGATGCLAPQVHRERHPAKSPHRPARTGR
jgi:hypothetical protein